MTDQYQNGDVTINKILLTSLDGQRKVDVTGQVSLINIYESIFQPTILGDIVFKDAIGLFSGFPLIGEEVVEIEFLTPGLDKFTYKFNLYKYEDVNAEARSMTYLGQLVSREGLINASKLMSRRFNSQISSTIRNILTDELQTTNTITIDPTLGVDNFLMSNLTPLQMIDCLRRRAISAQYKSSSFVFYQDREGFHFTTLEKMIENSNHPLYTYNFDDSIDTDVEHQNRFFDIIAYTTPQAANVIDRLQYGGSTNIVRRFDITTGQTHDIAYSDSSDQFATGGQVSREQSSQFNQMFGQTTSNRILVAYDENTNPQLNEKVSRLPGFVNRINQNVVNAAINGNSSLRLGQGVKCEISTSTGMTGTDNRITTNNYIVSKIRHIITMSNRPNYVQSVELLTNSYSAS